MGHSRLDPRAGFQANAQSFQSSFSFSYRIDISVHATTTQAGLQFQGAQFIPVPDYVQSSGSVRRLPGTADLLGARASSPRAHSRKVNALDDFAPFQVRHVAAAVCHGEEVSPATNRLRAGSPRSQEEPFDHERLFPISFVREGEVPIREPATLTTSTPWMTRRRRSRSRPSVISTLAGCRIRSIPTTASCGWRRYRTCSPPS